MTIENTTMNYMEVKQAVNIQVNENNHRRISTLKLTAVMQVQK